MTSCGSAHRLAIVGFDNDGFGAQDAQHIGQHPCVGRIFLDNQHAFHLLTQAGLQTRINIEHIGTMAPEGESSLYPIEHR